MKRFLIVLSNGEDMDIKLANPEAEAWIYSVSKDGIAWSETIPDAVIEGHEEMDGEPINRRIRVSCGSPDNDRALQCPGKSFGSIPELVSYCKTHDIEITNEYVGCIY
jgi:hypothetical protein